MLTALRDNVTRKARNKRVDVVRVSNRRGKQASERKERKGDALATVFLLNNYHYILKTVQGSGLKGCHDNEQIDDVVVVDDVHDRNRQCDDGGGPLCAAVQRARRGASEHAPSLIETFSFF